MFEGILIKGPLTEEDVKTFAGTLRQVEQKRPGETFMMVIMNELASNKEAAALLNTVFPAIDGVPYDVKTFKREPEPRHCVKCGARVEKGDADHPWTCVGKGNAANPAPFHECVGVRYCSTCNVRL